MTALSRAVFDGDVLVYKAGFSVETRRYTVHAVDDDTFGQNFQRKTDALNFIKRVEADGFKMELHHIKEVKPLRLAKLNLINIIQHAIKELKVKDYSIYLSPKDVTQGLRFKAAITRPYKGNRTGEKPKYYEVLREFAVRELQAVVAPDDLEADDLLGMASRTAIVCSIDKDLLMCPGVHYNLTTGDITKSAQPGSLHLVTAKDSRKTLKGYGFKWFCAQMLLGDSVDNIQGIKGMGSVGAFKELDSLNNTKDMWGCVQKIYKKHELEYTSRLEENKILLWINQPETFDEILEKY